MGGGARLRWSRRTFWLPRRWWWWRSWWWRSWWWWWWWRWWRLADGRVFPGCLTGLGVMPVGTSTLCFKRLPCRCRRWWRWRWCRRIRWWWWCRITRRRGRGVACRASRCWKRIILGYFFFADTLARGRLERDVDALVFRARDKNHLRRAIDIAWESPASESGP